MKTTESYVHKPESIRILGLALLMAILAGIPGHATAQQRYTPVFQDAELATVIEIFEAVLEQRFRVEPELVRNKRVTLVEQPPVTAEGMWDVLAGLLAQHDLVLIELENDRWQILPKPEPAAVEADFAP